MGRPEEIPQTSSAALNKENIPENTAKFFFLLMARKVQPARPQWMAINVASECDLRGIVMEGNESYILACSPTHTQMLGPSSLSTSSTVEEKAAATLIASAFKKD